MSIIEWFYYIVNFIFGYKKPKRVKQFYAEFISMSNVRVSWALPPVSPRQRPIQHTEISVRVSDTLPWTIQDTITPDVSQELVFVDVAPGTQYFRAVVVDVDGTRGPEDTTMTDVVFDPPGAVTALTAVVE
jgi:hypothetical protein